LEVCGKFYSGYVMVIELTLDWIYAFCSDEITFVIFLR
jgi:hypothetical protein